MLGFGFRTRAGHPPFWGWGALPTEAVLAAEELALQVQVPPRAAVNYTSCPARRAEIMIQSLKCEVGRRALEE